MFLYESLYCLALGLALLWIDSRFRLKRGQVFALYVAGYTAVRFVFEEMRVDPAHLIGPLRVNAWVSLVLFVASVGWFLWLGRHGTERPYAADAADGSGHSTDDGHTTSAEDASSL
jgi:prolipoprotein diacylglyceryltransferase